MNNYALKFLSVIYRNFGVGLRILKNLLMLTKSQSFVKGLRIIYIIINRKNSLSIYMYYWNNGPV